MNQQNKQDRLTPGQLLRRARTAKHWSIEDVSQRLKLSLSTIKKIESDQCDVNQDIYQRGYALNYAKLLGLDLERFQVALGDKTSTPMPLPAALSRTPQVHRAERVMRFATYALGTAVVAVPLVWSLTQGAANFFTQGGQSVGQSGQLEGLATDGTLKKASNNALNPSHLSASVAPLGGINQRSNNSLPAHSPLALSPEAQSGLTQGDNSSTPLVDPLLSHIPEFTNATEQDALVELLIDNGGPETEIVGVAAANRVAENRPDPTQRLSPPALRLRLQSDSWVEITDASGKRLEYNLLRGGSVNDYTGQAPYRILIGRATGVVLEHQGQQVDLAPYIRGNVASFELAKASVSQSASESTANGNFE